VGLASDLVDVASAVPAISFHFGHSLQQLNMADHRAVLQSQSGSVEAKFDLLVAADGANSTARNLLQVSQGVVLLDMTACGLSDSTCCRESFCMLLAFL